jgi:hypothetical protein
VTLDLADYRDCMQQADPAVADTLEAVFQEASRVMSPAGLHDYLEGGKGLCRLGRGSGVVIAYLEEMPAVVRECGEEVIRDVVEAALKLASLTSGEVIALLLATLPTAARRLGDPELLRGYLGFIHQLAGRAARGLRPMLNHLDELLAKLTLGGLRRWALFGADAYRRDSQNLQAYFDLATSDSRAMLQQLRRGTLFIDSQRRLNLYLRALWARDFFLRPTGADHEGFRPYIEQRVLHLPDAVDGCGGVSGLELYRATAAHMAAHLCYTTRAISAEQLSPAQMFFIGQLEDARVEYAAASAFPGLGRLWRSLLAVEHPAPEHPTVGLLEQLALMLRDPDVACADAELSAFAARFHAGIAARVDDPQWSWRLGMELFQLFAARREVPSLRLLQGLRIPYRDDNRYPWEFAEFDWASEVEYVPASQRQVRRQVSAVEMANEVDCEFAGDDAQEIWTCPTEFFPYEDAGVSYNAMWGREPVSAPFHYPEWDYQVQLHRPDWVAVYERRQPSGDPQAVDAILAEHKAITQRIRQIVDRLTPAGVQRQRNLEDGDEIDLNAAVDAMVALRMGQQPSPRITLRNVIKRRDLAVVVLLDLSESTNDPVAGSERTVLELTREAAALVATAIDGIGDPFAIHGFASDGRHDVQYYRFKDFNQPFDATAKARLAGMRGGLSTRMGAALRHAASHLRRQPEQRKLLLLVTDGAPADIDERDPQHLRHDTRKAVEELHTRGILTYCLTLDPQADSYVKRIFGAGHYTVIDHVQRLPEQLPTLFASLTR